MWLILAFSALGLLIGNLVGLSATSIVTPLLGLLFAFGGSSIIAFLHKLSGDDRKAAAQAVLAISLACLVGVYSGVLINQYRVLTPKARRWPVAVSASSKSVRGDESVPSGEKSNGATGNDPLLWTYERYVRSAIGKKADEIDVRYRNHEITSAVAYDSLYAAVQRIPRPPAQ